MLFLQRTLFIVPLIIVFGINCTVAVVVNWGEKCQFTSECADHRLICEEVTVKNITEKLCACDRFHEWSGVAIGCIPTTNIDDILRLTPQRYNVSAHIEYEANLIFTAQIVAGMLVMCVGVLCSVIVTGYCYRMWKQDSELDDIVRQLESQKLNNRAVTSRNRLR